MQTQQLIGRERGDWQQGREILSGRIELVEKEVSTLDEKVKQSESSVAETHRKRDELLAENDQLKAVTERLVSVVAAMEEEVRKLMKLAPDPIRAKLQPLLNRIPAGGVATRVSIGERFQNVLGVLDELNRANSEITISFEVRTLANGSSTEVQVIYVGLAQAYYISPRGEAGVGRPGVDGWVWEPAPQAANQILTALEIIQGKHTPSFVSLPVKIQ